MCTLNIIYSKHLRTMNLVRMNFSASAAVSRQEPAISLRGETGWRGVCGACDDWVHLAVVDNPKALKVIIE